MIIRFYHRRPVIETFTDFFHSLYYIFVFIAIGCHTHAFLFLFLPLLMGKPWGKRTFLLVAAVIFTILTYDSTLGTFLEYAQSIGLNVMENEVFDGHSINVLRVAVYGVPPLLMLVYRNRLFSNSTKVENLFSNMSIIAFLILSIGLAEGGNLFARMAGYFEWATAISLPWCIKKIFTEQSVKVLFVAAGILYTAYFIYDVIITKDFGNQYNAITIWQFIQSLF